MKPGGQRLADPQGPSLANQDEERRLKRILDVLGLAEDSPADGDNHGPVPGHEGSKSRFVPILGKSLNELRIRQAGRCAPDEEPAQIAQGCPELSARHCWYLSSHPSLQL